MFEAIAFYFFAALTIACFTIVVTANRAIYAFAALAAGMIFIGAFFFMLDADFMGVVQIVVYTGAVMALYAFGMMFFDSTQPLNETIGSQKLILFLAFASAAIVVAMVAAPALAISQSAETTLSEGDNIQTIGVELFTTYILPFELSGLLLLTAMIAGIVLASKKMEYSQEEERKK
ncbi:MAG: NADH-quinone oxidoreductase subunit J [Helicobacteraceae bacterium]|jgi:NADH-quinone oxidoreductase subunit J|nr:NADH-quinone oxidoreductase subunit J [Helicobacteraceae bacterium]